MARVISVHEYELRANKDESDLLAAVEAAEARGLFDLPGLIAYRFLRGVKGRGAGRFAAIWIYRDRAAWQALWGPASDPKGKDEYPESWRAWEDELLRPLLVHDPDKIQFTSFEVIHAWRLNQPNA